MLNPIQFSTSSWQLLPQRLAVFFGARHFFSVSFAMRFW
jgi:hypothetical protein